MFDDALTDHPWVIFRESIQECIRANQLRILVTGFEPFGGASWNPSGKLALALDGQTIRGGIIVGRILPVVWGEAPRLLEQYIEELRPHVAMALGMARDSIEIELSATNRRNPERRDNAGALAVPPRPIATKTLRTALPVDRIVRSSEGGSVRVNEDAGGYLCEEVFFALQSAREKLLETQRWPLLRSGFIHVPNDRHIADEEAFERLEKRILQAIEVTIAELIAVVHDRKNADVGSHVE